MRHRRYNNGQIVEGYVPTHTVIVFGDDEPLAMWCMDADTIRFVNQALVAAGHWEDQVRATLRDVENELERIGKM